MPFRFDFLLSGEDIRHMKCHASEDTKTRAVYTYLFLGETQSTIARFFSVSQPTVSRWVEEYFSLQNSDPPPDDLPVDNRSALVAFILEHVKDNPLLFLREIKSLVRQRFYSNVSVSTVHRILSRNGYSRKRVSTVLHRAKVQLHINFQHKLATSIGVIFHQQLVFIDEVSFRPEHFQRLYGRSPLNSPVFSEASNANVSQISVVVAIDRNGYVAHHLQEGHFDRIGFLRFLKDCISRGLFCTSGASRSILVLDGCKIHISEDLIQCVRKSGLSYFILPPYSPEANPIEVFFRTLRSRIRDLSTNHSNFGAIELIQEVLPAIRKNCSHVFDHCGWSNGWYFESPYLHGKRANELANKMDFN
ncbi:hypothetical protein RCL1_007688 [Eukaryota sp. TZLM3-RCL]